MFFLCVSVCMAFKFAAQARLSELHDEIEKAEQQILRATEEFKQLEEAVQLKKVGEHKAVLLRGDAESEACFPLHDCVKTVFKQSSHQCCLFNCGITNFRVRRGSSIFQFHFLPFRMTSN